MPGLYIGGGGGAPGFGPMPGPAQNDPRLGLPARGGFNSGAPVVRGPMNTGTPAAPTPTTNPGPTQPPNVVGAGVVRPSGPSGGFDPQYLQNLATAIGGLFSRPGGNLSFNPLGNLGDIQSQPLGGGTAPLPGLPSTLLQDALNNLAFMWSNPTTSTGTSASPTVGNTGGGGYNGGNFPRRPVLQ